MLYKGFIETKGKQSVEKLKGRSNWKTYEQVKNCDSFAGILADDVVLIDIDNYDQSEILMNIIEDKQIDCKVYQSTRGRHFLFRNHSLDRNRTGVRLAVGLTADIKVGSKLSYEVIKINGEERHCEWDIEGTKGQDYSEVPKWLFPVKSNVDFLDMKEGDGRNQALYDYILTLTSNGFSVDETRECITLINDYLFTEKLSKDELETILRDEAFQKPVFFSNNTFLFEVFAQYLKSNLHIVKINGQLHMYKDGIYTYEQSTLSAAMRELIPNIKRSQKLEVIDCLNDIAEEMKPSDAKYIAFNNGILDITTGELSEFTSGKILTNKIPWNYVPDAYNELADITLDKISCNDKSIRALLEECIGYCFYRRNELGKAFILTGDRSNGKSTFLDCIQAILGDDNICALDLKELGDRFSTSMMYGKLADIGDDIGDDFLQGNQVAIFKKVVTGNRIKAERKGQDPFEFNPFIKLLFSANDMPRMKDRTGAVLRRLVIIPFDAVFDSNDPDFDPFIKYKLIKQESVEYLITLGIRGLQRVLTVGFTESEKVQEKIDEYEIENNSIKAFIEDTDIEKIENEPTYDVYKRYQVFCANNTLIPVSHIAFSKQIVKQLELKIISRKISGVNRKTFVKN